jgi:hypothetical protein
VLRALFLTTSIAMALLTGCENKDTYRPVFYPNKSDLTNYERGPKFDNLAQARQWVDQKLTGCTAGTWDYEIGKNCKPFEDSDIEVCEETLK